MSVSSNDPPSPLYRKFELSFTESYFGEYPPYVWLFISECLSCKCLGDCVSHICVSLFYVRLMSLCVSNVCPMCPPVCLCVPCPHVCLSPCLACLCMSHICVLCVPCPPCLCLSASTGEGNSTIASQSSPDPFPIFHSPPAIHIAHVKRWLSIGGGRKKLEISSTHGQRQSSWLRLCRLPEDGGNAGADGKTCDDRFLQPGREVA